MKAWQRFCDTAEGAKLMAQALTLLYHNFDALDRETMLNMTEVKCITLLKPNGDFRPIGIARSLFRILQSVVVSKSKKALNEVLHPQDQTLRANGISNLIEATRELVNRHYQVAFSDQTNAFNSTDQSIATAILSEEGVTPMVQLLAAMSVHRVVDQNHGETYAGHIVQGSSSGSASMAVVMHAALRPLREQKAGSLYLTCADDLTVIAKDGVEALADRANAEIAKFGPVENKSKRVIYTAQSTSAAKTLGAYVGTVDQVKAALEPAVTEVLRLMNDLKEEVLGTPVADHPIRQTALRTFKVNLLPRLVHLIQHHRLECTLAYMELIDTATLDFMAGVLSLTEEEAALRAHQLRLPTSKGGFGLVSMAEMAIYQRLGTLIRSLSFVEQRLGDLGEIEGPILPEIAELIPQVLSKLSEEKDAALIADLNMIISWNARAITPDEDAKTAAKSIQKRLTDCHYTRKSEQWLASVDDPDLQERMNSICSPEAGRPLNVVTVIKPNQIADRDFIYYIRRRLLLPGIVGSHRCVETDRHNELDEHLDHAFACTARGMGVVHDYVKQGVFKAVKEITKQTKQKVNMEPTIVNWLKPEMEANKNAKTIEGLKARRADISIESAPLSVSSHAERRVTLIDVRHCSIRKGKTVSKGGTVQNGEEEKKAFYKKHFDFPKGVELVAFAVDAYGKWGEDAKSFLENLCKSASMGDTAHYNSLITKAREVISVAHARGVGNALFRCVDNCMSERAYNASCARGMRK